MVNRYRAPESRSCPVISSAVYSELIVVAVPPARRIPWNTVTNAGTFSVQATKITAAGNMANGQVTTSTSAGTLVASRATRRSVTIRNTDSSISVYVGIATVTSVNGMLLKAGESISLDFTGLVQVISASGSPVVAYVETYD